MVGLGKFRKLFWGRGMLPRRGLRIGIGVALVVLVALLVAVFVVAALASLLGAMGDQPGSLVLGWVAVGCGLLVVIDLLILVILLGFHCLDQPGEPPDRPS